MNEIQQFDAGRRRSDGEVARRPRSADMPARRRTREIDGRIGMFATTRVRPDRVRGSLNSIASWPAVHETPAPTLMDRRRSWRRLLWRARPSDLPGASRVLRGSAGFYEVLRGSARFCEVLRGSTRFCEVLRGSPRFCEAAMFHYAAGGMGMTAARQAREFRATDHGTTRTTEQHEPRKHEPRNNTSHGATRMNTEEHG